MTTMARKTLQSRALAGAMALALGGLGGVLPVTEAQAQPAPLTARGRTDAQLGDLLATLGPPDLGVGAQVAGDRCLNCHD